jgi:hypothetical protein
MKNQRVNIEFVEGQKLYITMLKCARVCERQHYKNYYAEKGHTESPNPKEKQLRKITQAKKERKKKLQRATG